MSRKIRMFFLLFVTIQLLHVPYTIYAEDVNVTDCLENEDCLEEEMEQPKEQDESDSELLADTESTPNSLAFNIVKMFFALLLVLALIYGILIILRRRNKLYQHSDVLENLGGIPLGPNRSIQIIRVGSSIYMVGVGENVEMLQELTDEEVKTMLLQKEDETNPSMTSFFEKILSQNKKSQEVSDDHFSDKLKAELNKLQFNRKNMIEKHHKKDDEHV